VPARKKVTRKNARQDEFTTLGHNLARNIVIILSIGCHTSGALPCLSPQGV
jgi:hypothetical protein